MENQDPVLNQTEPVLDPQLVDQDLLGGVNERVACLLLLDASSSMSGAKIAELNRGLQTFRDDLLADEMARPRVEVAIVAFGGNVRDQQDFVTADNFNSPSLDAQGGTPMGEAIVHGLGKLQERKAFYRANSTKVWRPWVILITDGEPTDD